MRRITCFVLGLCCWLSLTGLSAEEIPSLQVEWKNTQFRGVDLYAAGTKHIFSGNRELEVFESLPPPIQRLKESPAPPSIDIVLRALGVEPNQLSSMYHRPVYFVKEGEMILSTHLQFGRNGRVTTVVVENGSLEILLEKDETVECLPLSARAGLSARDPNLHYFKVVEQESPFALNPHPTGNPQDLFPWLNARPAVTRFEERNSCSPEAWVDAGSGKTEGNNVSAWAVVQGGMVGPVSVNQGTRGFVYPALYHLSSRFFVEAAAVNAFYRLNWLHDIFYQFGFRERDGNFQKSNFGRGGVENDRMLVDAYWHYAAVNGAFFSGTEIDGTPGYISLFRFTSGVQNVDRLSAFDNQIIIHEGTHGMTRRLVGAMDDHQSRSLNEGWSDAVALALLARQDQDPKAAYTFGAWPSFQFNGNLSFDENYYFGFRRFPTTTEMRMNPLTLADMDPALFEVSNEIPRSSLNLADFSFHSLGEIWSVTLWEIFGLLRDRYPLEKAKEVFMRLIIEGQKLTPPNPNFIEARDGILKADAWLFGKDHRALLWKSFAKRGMGLGARVPSADQISGVHESFTLPDDLKE